MLIKSYIGYEMTSGKIIQWHTLLPKNCKYSYFNVFILNVVFIFNKEQHTFKIHTKHVYAILLYLFI